MVYKYDAYSVLQSGQDLAKNVKSQSTNTKSENGVLDFKTKLSEVVGSERNKVQTPKVNEDNWKKNSRDFYKTAMEKQDKIKFNKEAVSRPETTKTETTENVENTDNIEVKDSKAAEVKETTPTTDATVEKLSTEEEKVDEKQPKVVTQTLEEMIKMLNTLLAQAAQQTSQGQQVPKEILDQLQQLTAALTNVQQTLPETVGSQKLSDLISSLKTVLDNVSKQEPKAAFQQILDLTAKVSDTTKQLVPQEKQMQIVTPLVTKAVEQKATEENKPIITVNENKEETKATETEKPKAEKVSTEAKSQVAKEETPKESASPVVTEKAVKEDTEKKEITAKTVSTETPKTDEKVAAANVKVDTTKEVKTDSKDVKTEDTEVKAVATDKTEETTKEDNKDAKNKDTSKDNTKDLTTIKKPIATSVEADKTITKDNFNVNLNNAANEKIPEKIEIAKVEKPVFIDRTELINQIIKKSELLVGDKQSELRMQLEPENLGKLTLKIAVEKGLVTAQFIAESQQVKEVLESSYNQLKDLLQQKGIGVQGFSVSVGQENTNSNKNSAYPLLKNNLKVANKGTTVVSYIDSDGYTSKTANPYDYHDGKVDFKA